MIRFSFLLRIQRMRFSEGTRQQPSHQNLLLATVAVRERGIGIERDEATTDRLVDEFARKALEIKPLGPRRGC